MEQVEQKESWGIKLKLRRKNKTELDDIMRVFCCDIKEYYEGFSSFPFELLIVIVSLNLGIKIGAVNKFYWVINKMSICTLHRYAIYYVCIFLCCCIEVAFILIFEFLVVKSVL